MVIDGDMSEWANKTHSCPYDAFQAIIVWNIIKYIKPKYIILEAVQAYKSLNNLLKKSIYRI